MQHLKIIEAGFDKLTGHAGNIEFVNGVSIEPVSEGDAARLSAAMRCEMTDGTNPSASGALIEGTNTPAPILEPIKFINKEEATIEAEVETKVESYKPAKFTRQDLESIADDKGIAGLRSIAIPMGVKSKSVGDLVEGILRVQAK